ncbi:carotenoid biosynthesis protein [Rossellomorea vietnamensis]|uniref:Carotenoid biosynthesis protein n=1 Tax=Rossellomorea vietnamensis TaxID=218284 RepID=A0A5D4NQZ1_9BACI|nr:carotenoid biosynthesis protein [Rossellomorea vietnamensis]TYS15272.1 carotenoid biosynthesis protein [Rossellomorea vietnamensis]
MARSLNGENLLYYFFLFWYACGVVLLSFDLLPASLQWANAVFLMLAGLIGSLYFLSAYGRITGAAFIGTIFIISMLAEGLGVHFGFLFGSYNYTSDFGWQLFGVPVAIGFAWLLVISTSHVIAVWFTRTFYKKNDALHSTLYILTGAVFTVGMDLIIDPVAFHVKQYWIWDDGLSFYYGVPLQNFSGWFLLALFFHLIIYILLRLQNNWPETISGYRSRRIVLLYILVTGMFMLLGLLNGLWLASFLAFVFIGAASFVYFGSAVEREDT